MVFGGGAWPALGTACAFPFPRHSLMRTTTSRRGAAPPIYTSIASLSPNRSGSRRPDSRWTASWAGRAIPTPWAGRSRFCRSLSRHASRSARGCIRRVEGTIASRRSDVTAGIRGPQDAPIYVVLDFHLVSKAYGVEKVRRHADPLRHTSNEIAGPMPHTSPR